MVERQQYCQNDGTKLTGDYCHTCGQSADEPRRAVIGLVQDVFVDTLAIDGKLARTIALLLFRPGVLARRYLDGKRVRYSPPFRLYLFASVFFFLAAFWMSDLDNLKPENIQPAEIKADDAMLEEIAQSDPELAEEVRRVRDRVNAEREDRADGAEESEADAEDSVSFNDMKWEDLDYSGPAWLEARLKRMFEAAQRVVEDPRLFIAESRQNLPRTLLLAPILYALILALLYIYRRKFYVYDHFVISLYMHAALYAYLLLSLLLSRIPGFGVLLLWVPLIWGWWQPAAVLRQAYGSGWVSVVIKWAIAITIYFIGVVLIVTLGLTYSLYQS
ncbi:MAG: DUF3667 domain-containing protein [Pseudomonadota bacterium]